jgi:hypothetical protein
VLGILVAAILSAKFAPEQGILNTGLSLLAVISIPAAIVAITRTPCPRCSHSMGVVAWSATNNNYGVSADARCPHCRVHVDEQMSVTPPK